MLPTRQGMHQKQPTIPLSECCRTVLLRSSPSLVRRQDNGFALIIVLWTLVLITFIVAHLTSSGRIEIRIANNLVANAAAQAAADGAIMRQSSSCRIRNRTSVGRWTAIPANC
jgi:Tfp pilus assembly protein PilX